MQQKELAQFRTMLLNQKSDLLNKSQAYKLEHQQEKDGSGDEADQAAKEYDLNMSIRLHERERVLVQKIDRALAKIEDGTFGFCQECGESMNVKRLIARPVADMCISCKEDQEVRERFYA